ncbi:MAG: hypothetical protein GYB66_10525 [Chloroflexi bacterium]|nr:hypothetical protein [Chloroflexota bacterium]
MGEKKLQVRIDDRVRLMSAVLAATKWPEREKHRPHQHARNTVKLVADFSHHPGVSGAQVLLDQGAPLEAFYTYALKLSWPGLENSQVPRWVPPNWNTHLKNFYEATKLEELWQAEHTEWQKARQESEDVLGKVDFYAFLKPFVGDVVEQLVFMPNISYPITRSIGVRIGGELVAIAPPREAWGDNPPWPFSEDPSHVYSASLSEYIRLLMLSYLRQNAEAVAPIAQKPLPVSDQFKEAYPNWGDQFTEVFVSGAVALFLEQAVSKSEAEAYVLMQHKAKGLNIVPGVVSVLRRYLRDYADNKYETFIKYMPNFPGHLRVAKTITTL